MVLFNVIEKNTGNIIELTIEEIVDLHYNDTIKLITLNDLNNLDKKYKNIVNEKYIETLKKKISNYTKKIPLYDVYSKKIYLIYRSNVYHRVIYNHYRLPDINLLNYHKIKDNKLSKNITRILSIYNFKYLEETYYKLFYYSQPKAFRLTICKKPSFDPNLDHIDPYYSKHELIHLGLNQNIININDIKLYDGDIPYNQLLKICNVVVKNDISYDILINHQNFIFENKTIGLVKNYSLFGSFFMNEYLRRIKLSNITNNESNIININRNMLLENSIKLMWNLMLDAPPIQNNFSLFRFIQNDSYLSHLNIGDTYIEDSFISTTRNPFYYESIKDNNYGHVFGFILIKINIKKDDKGILFIEGYSNFPHEQEVLLPPLSILRLDNINESFEFYHYDKEFTRKITRKYEFTYMGSHDIKLFDEYMSSKKINYNIPDIKHINLYNFNYNNNKNIAKNIRNFLKNIINENFQFESTVGNNTYLFTVESYDSTNIYSKFFFFQVKNGISIYITNQKYGNINLLIEINNQIHINYYFKHSLSELDQYININNKDWLEWIALLSYHLGINDIYIHPNYYFPISNKKNNSIAFKKITYEVNTYDYLKHNKKNFVDINEVIPNFDYYQLDYLKNISPDMLLSENDHDELYQVYIDNKKIINSVANLFIYIVDNKPILLKSLLNKMYRIYKDDNENPFLNSYYKFDGLSYLYNNKIIDSYPIFNNENNQDTYILREKYDYILSKTRIPRVLNRQEIISI
jgi:hypothetical protein